MERISIHKIVPTPFGGGSSSGYIENTWMVVGTFHGEDGYIDFVATAFEHIPECVCCDEGYMPDVQIGNIRKIISSGKNCQFEIGEEINISDEDVAFIEKAVSESKDV